VFTLIFWQATAERAVKSFAQALAATLGAGGIAFQDVDWVLALSVAGMTALLSVLTSLSSIKVGDVGMPSLVSRTPAQPAAASPAPEQELART
jgi:hypothetical protein